MESQGSRQAGAKPRAGALQSLIEAARQAARSGFSLVEDSAWLRQWLQCWQDALAQASGATWDELHLAIAGDMGRFEELGKSDRSRLVARILRAGAQLAATQPLPKPAPVPIASRFAARKPPDEAASDRRSGKSRPVSVSESQAPPVDLNDARAWPVSRLSGVGPKLAQRLEERGLATLGDLAFFLPSSYVDRRQTKTGDDLHDGEQGVVAGVVRHFKQSWFRGRYQGVVTLELEHAGELTGKTVEGRWFHRVGGLEQRFLPGQRVQLAGLVRLYRGQLSMVHPEILGSETPVETIAVHYPVQQGLSNQFMRKLCRAALDVLANQGFCDPVPSSMAPDLPDLLTSLRYLHAPAPDTPPSDVVALAAKSSPAHRRLAFDEFFYVQLACLRQRQSYVTSRCALAPLDPDPCARETLRASLPFEPTPAQWRAIAEIESDLQSGQPMLRLLQGDVGSGKTVVAFAAAWFCASAGGQSAIMAPTELLAAQHLRTLAPWCAKAGLKVALLTGSMRRAERASLLALLAGRQIDIVVGTHALLVQDVVFAKLGLVVVDEQHRFGVEQRSRLRDKGEAPHFLVMTATPIPRTLALAAHGELEISLMQGLPPGRTPPITKVFAGATSLAKARARLIAAVGKGVQAFVVCPLVEASEAIDVSDVEATARELREAMPDVDVALVHGRMSSADKDAAMHRFHSGLARVLVATTVIEVGVDVPQARVILVEHAERFGLAQLHQLRGRIGRSEGPSLCLLHTAHGPSSSAGQRLRVLENTSDGFAVAEADLELRGPGEVFGTKQSGLPRLRFASFGREGLEILTQARQAAGQTLAVDPQLQNHPELARELARRMATGMVFSMDAG